jgi:periodic tryptophan protein 2
LALHLNDSALVRRVVDETPMGAIRLVATAVPTTFLARLLEIIAASLLPEAAAVATDAALTQTPHLEFALTWAISLLEANGKPMRAHPGLFAPGLRSLQRALLFHRDTLGKLVSSNRYMLEFLASRAPSSSAPKGAAGPPS